MEDFCNYPFLQRIHSPEDLKTLSDKELCELAKEIRSYLVERVGENGGHLASNLGVVRCPAHQKQVTHRQREEF